MLANFDLFARALLQYLNTIEAFGITDGELKSWVAKIRFGLIAAPFVGMVVRKPPPSHLAFDLVVDVRKPNAPKRKDRRQNPAFVRWWSNLSNLEVKQRPRHGAGAYRITHITPRCVTEQVKFHRIFGWISPSELRQVEWEKKSQ
ncbi:MAG: hypothetical protein COV91_05840 [Candidatus Taylorbacteria bacterium CG11_big_fil_rev_8_21_14_0_20_46_11]|uniref:Uncharacterized protein n=1 Tax=Candidatus Taylorbacteria bacterium CG11_big_fil_rev_8_21_14_0_20_46_11 TaxID=1975025 RepID=A0A2H0KA84_9BACT|nr:MAG: hypothetical protein COV91_05840 [Candidatus Taylorbacteria bacterium CG11_big_fil_rev_8_21_14_0_20_46_11]